MVPSLELQAMERKKEIRMGDVDPTTVVNNLQDESLFHPYLYENSSIYCNTIDEIPSDDSNDIIDSQSRFIPQFSPPRSIVDDAPPLDRSINPSPTLRTSSCLLDDDPSFRVESPNTLMFLANHNLWEDELSQDSHYTPFDDEFSQDEINAIKNNK
ncbi:hypothetical protein L1987_13633 [Smallanthus sonchifolius]|uniref:Uncharacterized protein n=1 Tax=Smallanthus sonchifolius TaxID=185202 RepID=A0ACB9JI37_9ASTR|nr:hypothetical protein L1987_13633 [Smallanthus sonchifolius]